MLTPAALKRMLAIGRTFRGKHYDLFFGWSDDRLYCSELVWKIYDRALGIQIGARQHLDDFDLTAPQVRQKIRQRWGDHPPATEPVISPAAMFASDRLVTIYRQ